jgi:uncharacterized small protein (DUF1192 family)
MNWNQRVWIGQQELLAPVSNAVGDLMFAYAELQKNWTLAQNEIERLKAELKGVKK